jgi:hypothetical protein
MAAEIPEVLRRRSSGSAPRSALYRTIWAKPGGYGERLLVLRPCRRAVPHLLDPIRAGPGPALYVLLPDLPRRRR